MRVIKRILGAILVLTIISAKPCAAAEVLETVPNPAASAADFVGYIFVGDSRLQGVEIYTGISKLPNVWVVAETSKGYNWLTTGAAARVNSIEKSNPQVTRWVEIYTLGINDPGNKNKYCEWYMTRALDHNVILMSMNPIEHHRSLNDNIIRDFNMALISTGLKYMDCYSYLVSQGFKTADGVHYNVTTNKKISDFALASAVQLSY